MQFAFTLVVIAGTVIVVSRLASGRGFPVPLAMLAVGVVGSLLPFVPDLDLSPEVVLFGLLPPLLYAAAIQTSLIDIEENRVTIIGLSVGLVLFTAAGVGALVHVLLGIPFALAFALGAVVAPPDAVAATAVARRIGLPRRITTILEGESLLNDATALVSLRTALAVAGLATGHHGEHVVRHVTANSVTLAFLWAVVGGVGIGVVVFLLVGWVRRQLTETVADTALSFVVPFLAYLPAEYVGASGVLAVVTAGLFLAHKSPILQSAASRMSERINWASITFLLENAVFLLIGLQISHIVMDVEDSSVSLPYALLVSLLVLLACLVLRPLWCFPFRFLADRIAHRRTPPRHIAVVSWAGMRGVVTLAAALTIPTYADDRSVLVLVALVVTVGTLVLGTFTLPMLARALDVRGPDPREDALQEATVVQAATSAGLRALEKDPDSEQHALEIIRRQADMRVNRVWERLGTLRGDDGASETPSETYRRMRLAMLDAERAKVLRIRDAGSVDHEVLQSVMNQLDAEEAALQWGVTRQARLRDAVLRAPDRVAASCEHLAAAPDSTVPRTPEGCEECLRLGWDWVHLRLCLTCGHVGCCDSSRGKHADAHYAETGHPVMQSLEPGEAWRWCYVDSVLG
ncbi:putative sodium/proton antiporter [Nostocoides japonicum T1-X7]|uniref:Putative sodium/proton antiporter n=1 Tax=Nostocoides japonicum T1-X7 TaxID=1194083 RepID=A0A077M5D9_9MICO|nr:Na+/H+ antiporter [Tetrasphaera japonica]CCH79280.1 putative sodium/proton antiporter [Tetrasphaera japonica T1-X7]